MRWRCISWVMRLKLKKPKRKRQPRKSGRSCGSTIHPELVVLAAAVKQAGYPEAQFEYPFHPTRKWRFDLSVNELKVALERHGGIWHGGRHTTGKGFSSDRSKANEAQLLGWIILECTPEMIRNGEALEQLLRALEMRSQ
jgi:hypothetical protein